MLQGAVRDALVQVMSNVAAARSFHVQTLLLGMLGYGCRLASAPVSSSPPTFIVSTHLPLKGIKNIMDMNFR